MSTTRREFLSVSLGGAALASLGAGVPSLWGRLALAGAPQHADRDTILIVVQLAGGNDGLNTVVPYADDHYARNRRTLRLTEREVHKIDAQLGFHPRMEAFKRLYDEGHLAVVQGVAYPNQNESHPEAMAAWQTAMPGETNCQTGWIGRVVDELIGQQQVVIKSLGDRFEALRGISGAAILGDGRVGLILEMSGLALAHHARRASVIDKCTATSPATDSEVGADDEPEGATVESEDAVSVPN